MFEGMTYEELMRRALARVSGALDQREGSMVWDGVAPSMAELAQLYIGLDFVLSATYLATAPRDYLIRRAAERNMAPYPASAAVYRAELDAPAGSGIRFSCGDVNFILAERLERPEDAPGVFSYRAVCETAGSAGNHSAGMLIPIEYVDGLTRAELTELLIPGADEEETETFRQRVLDSFRVQAFGGNQADYREKVSAIPGVGGVKVYPVWNGDLRPAALIPDEETTAWYTSASSALPEGVRSWLAAVYAAASQKKLTIGGTVRLVIVAAGNTVPSAELVELVQTRIDPAANAGEGLGLAPIGHVVQVDGAAAQQVDVTLHMIYAEGWDWDAAKPYIEEVLDGYFSELAQDWASAPQLTVRISQIESRILTTCGAMVTDLGGTAINGVEGNLALDADSIPVRGEVHG